MLGIASRVRLHFSIENPAAQVGTTISRVLIWLYRRLAHQNHRGPKELFHFAAELVGTNSSEFVVVTSGGTTATAFVSGPRCKSVRRTARAA
jgi:hypothetical protein